MRSIFFAFGRGFVAVARTWRVTFLLWLLHTVAAFIVALPVFAVLQKHMAHRPGADTLLQKFELSWAADLWQTSANTPTLILVLFFVVCGLYLVLNIFLSAGVTGLLFHRENPASLTYCFHYAGRYGFRFFRVFLLSIVVYGLCLTLYHVTLANWISRHFAEHLSEPTVAWANWIKTFGYVLIFAVLYLTFVYVKIVLVLESSGKVFHTTFRMFRWIFRHLGKIVCLGFLLLIPTVGLWWGYSILEPTFPFSGSWPLWLGLIALQQTVVWLRGVLRVWFLGSQLSLYQEVG